MDSISVKTSIPCCGADGEKILGCAVPGHNPPKAATLHAAVFPGTMSRDCGAWPRGGLGFSPSPRSADRVCGAAQEFP